MAHGQHVQIRGPGEDDGRDHFCPGREDSSKWCWFCSCRWKWRSREGAAGAKGIQSVFLPWQVLNPEGILSPHALASSLTVGRARLQAGPASLLTGWMSPLHAETPRLLPGSI